MISLGDITTLYYLRLIPKKLTLFFSGQAAREKWRSMSLLGKTFNIAEFNYNRFVIPLDEDRSIPQLRKGLKVRIKSCKRFDEDDLWNLNNDLCMLKAYIEEVKVIIIDIFMSYFFREGRFLKKSKRKSTLKTKQIHKKTKVSKVF